MTIKPPTYVLLCLDPNCHGEFYLPLEPGEAKVCPNDREHPVEVYSVVRAAPAKLTGLPDADSLDGDWVDEDVPYFPPLTRRGDALTYSDDAPWFKAGLNFSFPAPDADDADRIVGDVMSHIIGSTGAGAVGCTLILAGPDTCDDCGASIEQDGSCGCEPGKGRK